MKLHRTIAVVALAGALVAGCGSSSGPSSNSGGNNGSNGIANESALQILNAAANALKTANSVTLVGSLPSNGKPTQINGTFFANGDADTTLGLSGSTVQLIKIGSNDYFQAPAAYWQAQGVPSSLSSKLDGVWVIIPDSQAKLGAKLSLSAFAAHATTDASSYTKGSTSTVDGQAVIAIVSPSQGTVYVATTGTPYPVQAVLTGTNGGTLTFSNWNSGTLPTVPAGAKTIAELGLGGPSGSSGASGAGATGTT